MPCWPVSHRDGKFQVTDSDGILYPITMGRAPVESLQPGWVPVGLQTGLKPFHLLELRNEGGPIHDAVWYLTEELDYANNTSTRFTDEQATQVVSNLSPLLRDIYDRSLCGTVPGVAESTHDFDGINPLFVRELISFVVDTALSPPDMVSAQRLDSISSHYMAAGVRLSASLLRHSLDITAPAALEPRLTIASPFDAALLTAQEEFAPDDGVLSQVYRFHDPVGNLAFYLLFAHSTSPDSINPGTASALYIPVANTVFSTSDALTGAQVMASLFSHYASHTHRVIETARSVAAPAATGQEELPSLPDQNHPEPLQSDQEFHREPGPEEPGSPIVPYSAHPAADDLAQTPHEAAFEPTPEALPAHDPSIEPAESPAELPAVTAADRLTEPAVPRPANWWKRLFGLGHP